MERKFRNTRKYVKTRGIIDIFTKLKYAHTHSTSSAEVTFQKKYKVLSLELKLAPGGILGTSNVNSSPSGSDASKTSTNVSPKVTVIEVIFCEKTGLLFSKQIN